ncbi:MAG: NAD(P)-dependent alcohol dehydrogenase [Phycisphaerae bacterium]|nr:NAD(P)-dependent alcohol dehydrogenase [Gemmatimonadaceae bacterium]
MIPALGYAAHDATSPLRAWNFDRRDIGARDVHIQILFCGVCHSDLHTVRGEWGGSTYPQVPGHEIVGRVVGTGAEVTAHKAGDLVGVGCLVDSCRTCSACAKDLEQYCEIRSTGTYGGIEAQTGRPTQGGYSTQIVVDEHFVLRVPAGLDLARTAPLLCAGITTYSPLREWGAGPGMRVGVVGLGGLGHMGIKLAHAMGAEVVLLTTSANKAEDAKRLGASDVIVSRDESQLKKHARSLDIILDTVSAPHHLGPELNLLARDGTLVLLGGSPDPHPAQPVWPFILQRRRMAGSLIGGLAETQEMLDFCAQHRIVSDVEIIRMDQINDAYERMLKSDVKYRFVIDMSSLA